MMYALFDRLGIPTIRLALSYLSIIMVLSIGFSIIFYSTSTGSLNLQLHSTSGGPEVITNLPQDTNVGTFRGIGNQLISNPPSNSPSDIAALNAQLQKNITAIRTGLLWQLFDLNIGALLIGGALSYYLARRTLHPIEVMMDAQARFASDASHELRTPLTIMQAELEVVLKKPQLTIERAKTALKSNYQEVTRLRQLSEGLLQLTHDPHGNYTFTSVFLDEVVNEAINQVIKLAQAKHIVIADTLPKLTVQGDTQSLVQVVVILLDNAIKYSPSGSMIHIEGWSQGRHVYLSVHDEGPGIRATDLPHIFERFYRADSSRSKHKVSGYGLGLSIAQKIIYQHRGDISVKSTLGNGAIFTIKLPI